MSESIRVAIVEDNSDFRSDLEHLIDSATDRFKLVGSFDSAEAALRNLPAIRPQVILMDIGLPGLSGIECVRQLSPILPKAQIMMLTIHDDSGRIFESLRAGATGFLLKKDAFEKLFSAMVTLFEGGSPMTNSVARRVTLAFRQFEENGEVTSKLTSRELTILRAVSEGQSNKELASMFGVAICTIEAHLRNIYEKLQVNSRRKAVQKLRFFSKTSKP